MDDSGALPVAAESPSRHTSPVDRMVDLLAEAVDAPLAVAATLTGRRLVLCGTRGMSDAATDPVKGPLVLSLCADVAAVGVPLIVGDAAADPRVDNAALLRRHEVAAYVGYPVRNALARMVGVICVLDQRRRRWTARELTTVDNAAQLLADLLGTTNPGTDTDTGTVAGAAGDRQRAFLDALLDSLDTGVAACDEQGRLVSFNRALRAAVGTGPDGSPPHSWAERFHIQHPDGRPFAEAEMPLVRALGGEHVRGADLLMAIPGKPPRRYTVNAEAIVDQQGNRLGAVAAVHDVTDNRRLDRFRRCELAAAQALAGATGTAEAGREVLAALGATGLWHYAELWLHDRVADVIEPAARWSRPGFEPAVGVPDRLAPGVGLPGAVWRAREPLWIADIHADGVLATAAAMGSTLRSATAVPVTSGTDVIGAIVLFAVDAAPPDDLLTGLLSRVAAQLGHHFERRRAADFELQLARAKDEYVGLVGHELRTPLTSIVAYAELLQDLDNLSDEAREMVQIIARNGENLRRVVGQLLDLAALDSGHAEMQMADADLTEIVRAALRDVTPDAAEWRVDIRSALPARAPVRGDPGRLREVARALLSNAVKYSHPGGTVSVSLEATGGGAVLVVTDHGVGIAAEDLDRVFERFHRGARARDLGIPGAGLGLATSRIIVNRHHGSIRLNHTEGGGVTAVLRLPAR
jgi:signal transduction histidine kinase/PAS domain-containing protein